VVGHQRDEQRCTEHAAGETCQPTREQSHRHRNAHRQSAGKAIPGAWIADHPDEYHDGSDRGD
jgi:hypothetical protein